MLTRLSLLLGACAWLLPEAAQAARPSLSRVVCASLSVELAYSVHVHDCAGAASRRAVVGCPRLPAEFD